jgi:hypothetical protein
MFRRKRKIKRMFHRVEKSNKHESSIALVQGTGFMAGGITAAIYFIKDLVAGNVELLSVAGLILSLISGITGNYLIQKGLRYRE